jgi:prevent-host-death family protein
MKRAAVSTIKATFSACLAKVKAGEELLVVERGKPVAKLIPVQKGEDDKTMTAQLSELARAGLIRMGTGKLPAGFWKLARPKDRRSRALQALLDERVEGR